MTKSRNLPMGTKGKHRTSSLNPARAKAIKLGATTYKSGKPCKRGHSGLRRTINGECVHCHRDWARENIQRSRRNQVVWRAANMHRVAAYRKHLPPTRPRPALCECCKRRRKLCMDHDHATLKFRGWICAGCNGGIGNLGDSIPGLQMGIAYLERARDAS